MLLTAGCSGDDDFDLPEVAGGHPVTATTRGGLLEHNGMTAGGQLATIACMWAEIGGALLFDGAIRLRSAQSSLVNLGAMSLTQGEPAEGGLVMSGPLVPQQYNGWRTRVRDTLHDGEIVVDARGTRIGLAFTEFPADTTTGRVRYVMLDTTSL